ncbi:hypothetical protein CC78DRAFT_510117 [Lojkania enalia]|uniref:Zn(2)-C6 fungal-type domain-containing protein n=1 Tax=Lojkania enalia TaxID=147567 RepID=A0A9P4N995_9PLEO|nr:hypothetical protein CC78DRAFT_510117 [Didymosphaeria enalia]
MSTPSQASKPQRVLACVSCQQRKVKCDRKFPCVHCIKSRTQCVPATLAPRRRRRVFPEQDELLDRLRRYEELLRQNNIDFEPYSNSIASNKQPLSAESNYDSDNQPPVSTPSTAASSEQVYEAKNIWRTMGEFRDAEHDDNPLHDSLHEGVKRAWDSLIDNDDHLLFDSRKASIDLSKLHPSPVQIFRLWQIYLDNVNPLLKVTHTSSLQAQIIEAASNLAKIKPSLEALIFSIYSMSILSLEEDDCQAIFSTPKEHLLKDYQLGCRQALSNCGFLRSDNRESLTALFLYLVSVRSCTVPQSLSSMLGVAIRIAQRIGIHNEGILSRYSIFEAEMRRRLWWALILFDSRIGEMADYKATTLAPTWDCKVPLNVNDSDLWPEMKEPPVIQAKFSDALFVVVRSELGSFIRHAPFYLDFTIPALRPIAKSGDLNVFETAIEDKYLRHCSPENPLHVMTLWNSRSYFARCRLMEHHSRYSDPSIELSDSARDAAIGHAISMLENDTRIKSSPLTKSFLWIANLYFPLFAYIHIAQELGQRPTCVPAEAAWRSMSENYKASFPPRYKGTGPFFAVFAKLILHAWAAREGAFQQVGQACTMPSIVQSIINIVGQTQKYVDPEMSQEVTGLTKTVVDFEMSTPISFGGHSLLYGMQGEFNYGISIGGNNSHMPIQTAIGFDMDQLDWGAMNWD